MVLTPEQSAAMAAATAAGRDPSQRSQIIDSASIMASPYAVKNWLNYGMGSSSNYKDDTVPLYAGHDYTLVDNKTGEVLARGSTPEEIQKIQSIVSDTLASQGRQADWRLYDANPYGGITNMHETVRGPYLNVSTPGDPRGVVVAGNTPDASLLENIGKAAGTVLPMAISFIPGFGQLAAGLQVAAGAGAGGLGAAMRGDDILKGAIMGGATSAGGQFLGGAGGPLSKLGLASDVATAVGTGLGATGGGLATGQSLKNSLIGGVTAGGMNYLGGKLFGPSQNDIINQNVSNAMSGLENGLIDVGAFAPDLINAAYTGAGVLDDAGRLIPFSPDGALPAPWANNTPPSYPTTSVPSGVDPAMVVTGTRLSNPTFSGGGNFIPSARYSGDGPTPNEIVLTAKKDVPAVEDRSPLAVIPAATTPSEIIVNAQKDVPAVEDDYTRINPVVPNFDAGITVTAPKKEVYQPEDKSLAVPIDVGSTLATVDNNPDITKGKDGLTTEQKLKLAALALSTLGGLGGGGGSGGSGTVPAGLGQLRSPVFDQKLSVLTPEQNRAKYGARNMTGTDWATWGSRPATSFFQNVDEQPTGMAHGGSFAAKRGGSKPRTQFAVNGPGTGRSDDIPAVLSDGEYVMDAETVALLGDGSSKAGAKKLDDLRVKVRKHKGKKLAQGRFSANAKSPEAYLSGGRA